jgi:glycosyltransferase involved in cell wall biosynthesis
LPDFHYDRQTLLKIALVHNAYGKLSGEETAVSQIADLLRIKTHQVVRFSRSSTEISQKVAGKLQALFAGIYNPFSRRLFANFLDTKAPDMVHIHNLYPFISASILPECTKRDIPVVMTLHNFRLVCPNALLLRNGHLCDRCLGGNEWLCIRYNCERSILKSIGYSARTAFARISGLIIRHTSQFICLTNFHRNLFLGAHFPKEKMSVVPNFVPYIQETASKTKNSAYVGFVGRISPEKDVSLLLKAAHLLPEIPFRVAGSLWRMNDIVHRAPSNVEFVDHLNAQQLNEFYANMGLMAFTTAWYEGFPMVLLEAMSRGVPLVCTRIGGLAEIVEHGHNGLLYEPGNAREMAEHIRRLWDDPALCKRLGDAGCEKVNREYKSDVVYSKLMKVYSKAAENKGTLLNLENFDAA